MSRHEGVSCDSCLKGNFRGRRFKCLICYDYDLCATCYESGATTARHTTDHPMQCILTRTDFDLYYGGEALSFDQPQAFTCPYCSRMGLTEVALLDHVNAEHADSSSEVVCPICAALPSGDPNYVTDDFVAHLTLEHRAPRELEEPIGSIRHVRRIPHPGRGVGGSRTRRANMHFQSSGGNLSGLAPSNRDSVDPIAELLSQLSSVRSRAAAAQSVSSQLQQLEMQLQTTRQQLERLPRRSGVETSRATANGNPAPVNMFDFVSAVTGGNNNNSSSSASASSTSASSQFLLARFGEPDLSETEKQVVEVERADRSVFVQELLLSSLAEGLRLDSEDDDEDEDCMDMCARAGRGAVKAESVECSRYQPSPLPEAVSEDSSAVTEVFEDGIETTSPTTNGPTNDVIMLAPSGQRERASPDPAGTNGNLVKRNKEPTAGDRNKSGVPGQVGRGSNTPPPKKGH